MKKLAIIKKQSLLLLFSGALLLALIQRAGWANVLDQLNYYSTEVIVEISLILALALLTVLMRSYSIMRSFNIQIDFITSAKANMSGYVAGLFSVPLVGNIVGRQVIFNSVKLPSSINAFQFAYEKIILIISSVLMAILAGSYLFGVSEFQNFIGRFPVITVSVTIVLSGLLGWRVGSSKFELMLADRFMVWASLLQFIKDFIITLLGQFMMVTAYVVAMRGLSINVSIFSLYACATLISAAASFPISAGGWGVRELASVWVLGKLGVTAPTAFSMSVTVGLLSSLINVLAAVALFNFAAKKRYQLSTQARGAENVAVTDYVYTKELIRISAWCLGFLGCLLIFFQIHISLAEGEINLNLADPFALLAVGVVVMQGINSKSLPSWRMSQFNLIVIAISLLLFEGFIHGWLKVGITQWALSARLVGWLVLLGYASLGYLVVEYHGYKAIHRFATTLIVTASVIILTQIIIRLLSALGVNLFGFQSVNFEGFAGNRNAFSFQLTQVLALSIGFLPVYLRGMKIKNLSENYIRVVYSILVLGVILAGSRAGYVALGILLVVAVVFNFINLRFCIYTLAIAGILWSLVFFMPGMMRIAASQLQLTFIPVDFSNGGIVLQNNITDFSNDKLRWDINQRALSLWLSDPLFGAGLGVFYQQSSSWFSQQVVIHSSFIWLLAELGMLGLGIVAFSYYKLLKHAWSKWNIIPTQFYKRSLFLVLLIISIFSLFHDVFYQRIFWMIIGVLLARYKVRDSGEELINPKPDLNVGN